MHLDGQPVTNKNCPFRSGGARPSSVLRLPSRLQSNVVSNSPTIGWLTVWAPLLAAGNPRIVITTSHIMTSFALGALALIAVGLLSNAIEATRAEHGPRGLLHGLATLALLFVSLLLGRGFLPEQPMSAIVLLAGCMISYGIAHAPTSCLSDQTRLVAIRSVLRRSAHRCCVSR